MIVLWTLLIAFLFVGSTGVGRASSCLSIADTEKRYECQAIERGDPNVCISIRNPDQREMCRVQAELAKRVRR